MNMNHRPAITSLRAAIAVGIFIGLIGVLLATTWIALSIIGERRLSGARRSAARTARPRSRALPPALPSSKDRR